MDKLGVGIYERWRSSVDERADKVVFVSPCGAVHERVTFVDYDASFSYDRHGYESVALVGPANRSVRFTPNEIGTWRYTPMCDNQPIGEGEFTCVESLNPGYVIVSPHDPRYFCFSDGSPYVPIGLNLCWPTMYALSSGQEFLVTAQRATFGAREFERWFDRLAANGGNFARLWLGATYFQPEPEIAGALDFTRLAAIDRAVDLARSKGIRLKLCLEYFRTFEQGHMQSRHLLHPDDGRSPASMEAWFTSDEWQSLWMAKVDALLARYGDDPVVMAWELWNEIDCCYAASFDIVNEWTRRMLGVIKASSPRNLVTNSLGSFDLEAKQALQDAFKMPEMDFQQVHAYIDQGAARPACKTDAVAMAVTCVDLARRPDRPILLAETGAVNDCHSGPFGFYGWDDDGLIMHDTTYSPFFAGAAGSGHIWHWAVYVDAKNHWPQFKALSDAIDGIAVDREYFEVIDMSTQECWQLALRGRSTSLLWLRNKADRWDHVLRDGIPAPELTLSVDVARLLQSNSRIDLFRPWPDDGVGAPYLTGTTLTLPGFNHGLIVRFASAS
ncbi:MAG TPA: hypothetical protein VGK19_18490 [Capsulimonadaceae bacterium]|jgi:hypothetical protein